jgi:hypothetical protein
MQNGAAVEANLSSTLGQWAADSWADDRNHFGKPRPEARAEPMSPSTISVSARYGFRHISCRGNVLRFHLTPAGFFIVQATDTPQMLRDVGSDRSVKGAHDVRARGLPQFPVMPDLKTVTERCCILSGITAREHFTRCMLMSSRHALRADRIIGRKTP